MTPSKTKSAHATASTLNPSHASTPHATQTTKGDSTVKKIEPASAPASSATSPLPPAPAPDPTEAEVAGMLDQLDAIASSLGANAVPLTIAERRRLLRIRPGGADHAATAVATATRYGLVIPGVTSAQVKSDAELAQNLGALIARLESMKGLVEDMSLQAQSRLWRSGTTAFAMLARLVPQYPSLQRELTPMAAFLAVTHKDAPTSIRRQEKTSLARSRKKKKGAAAASPPAASPAVAPPAQPSSHPAPEAAAVATPAPSAAPTTVTATA